MLANHGVTEEVDLCEKDWSRIRTYAKCAVVFSFAMAVVLFLLLLTFPARGQGIQELVLGETVSTRFYLCDRVDEVYSIIEAERTRDVRSARILQNLFSNMESPLYPDEMLCGRYSGAATVLEIIERVDIHESRTLAVIVVQAHGLGNRLYFSVTSLIVFEGEPI